MIVLPWAHCPHECHHEYRWIGFEEDVRALRLPRNKVEVWISFLQINQVAVIHAGLDILLDELREGGGVLTDATSSLPASQSFTFSTILNTSQ